MNKEHVKLVLNIIATASMTYGISKLSAMESGISKLNTQMATVIERTVNQKNNIDENRADIKRLQDMVFGRTQ